jgi:hypothetical protein
MALCGTYEPGTPVNNPPARNPEQLLTEDEVVAAVRGHLEGAGWVIKTWALAIEHGDDIVAEREGRRLIVEAKGEGSSKTGSRSSAIRLRAAKWAATYPGPSTRRYVLWPKTRKPEWLFLTHLCIAPSWALSSP